MTPTLTAAPVTDYAIIVDRSDNVAVVKQETAPGLELLLTNGRVVRVNAAVPPGHRFATRAIPTGEYVLQYGQPIGTSLGIECGDAITRENMSNDVPVIRELRAGLHTAAPDYIPERERAAFMGFRRDDGR